MQLELTKKQYELLLELASLGQIVRIVDKLSRPDKVECTLHAILQQKGSNIGFCSFG